MPNNSDCVRNFQNAVLQKNSFLFSVRYVDDAITFIDTFVYTVDRIVQITNSVNNNIKYTYQIEKNNFLSFLDTLVCSNVNGFSPSAFRKLLLFRNFLMPTFVTSCFKNGSICYITLIDSKVKNLM